MKFGPVAKEKMSFEDTLAASFIQWTGTICAISKEGITENNPVIWTSGSGGNAILYSAFL